MTGYQVREADLTAEDQAHLYGRLFPRLRELKRIARERLAANDKRSAS